MNLLLDTHTLLWLTTDPDKLSAQARTLLADPHNKLTVSMSLRNQGVADEQISAAITEAGLQTALEGSMAVSALGPRPTPLDKSRPHKSPPVTTPPPLHKKPTPKSHQTQQRRTPHHVS